MSVLPRCTRSLARHARSFHSSLVRADLVGPPDPISHLRPVIYDDAPVPPSPTSHPYSLREFAGDTREYQWKVQRQETDAFNQAFWTDSNTRFEAGLAAHLASLPESCTAEEREFAMSDFYSRWIIEERSRQEAYHAEWQKRNWSNIWLEARVRYRKFMESMGLGSSSV